jgi:4-hydroxyphenylpyruvate dioxygenase-like putative hemolysin
MTETSRLHHVVFAVPAPRHDETAKLFREIGFHLDGGELNELGIRVSLDWSGGIELISPLPSATTGVAASVERFLAAHGSGIYTVVIQVPGAAAAESVMERYGSVTRFRQQIDGEGTYLEEIDLSVLDLPLTLLATNVP